MFGRSLSLLVIGLFVALVGCKKEAMPTGVSPRLAEGLALVPAQARFVLVADVPRLAGSALARSLFHLVNTKPEPAAALEAWETLCPKLTLSTVGTLLMAGGGNGPDVVFVPLGPLREADVTSCMGAIMTRKGGGLAAAQVAGQTAYHADSSDPTDNGWWAMSASGLPVLAGGREWLALALDPATPKLVGTPLAGLLREVDQRRPLWFAALLEGEELGGLVEGLPDPPAHGPTSIRGSASITDGIELDVVLGMVDAVDAGKLAVALRAAIARGKAELPTEARRPAEHIRIEAEGATVRVVVAFDREDIELIRRFATAT